MHRGPASQPHVTASPHNVLRTFILSEMTFRPFLKSSIHRGPCSELPHFVTYPAKLPLFVAWIMSQVHASDYHWKCLRQTVTFGEIFEWGFKLGFQNMLYAFDTSYEGKQ
jgi:hypothetical protein